MTFQYHSDTDVLYIQLLEGVSVESDEVAPGIVLDYDASSRVIGIEIEDARLRVDLSRLEVFALPLADLVMSERIPADCRRRRRQRISASA